MATELQRDGWRVGEQVGVNADGEALHTIHFTRDGMMWATILTRDEARCEASIGWDGTPAEVVGPIEVERPFDPFRDYGVCGADFV